MGFVANCTSGSFATVDAFAEKGENKDTPA